jgi:hypothetical protein
MGVAVLDLEELLRALKLKSVLSDAQLRELIEQIELKDRTVIKAKDEILKDTIHRTDE